MIHGYIVSEAGGGVERDMNRITGNIRILVGGAESFLGELWFFWAVMAAYSWFITINV